MDRVIVELGLAVKLYELWGGEPLQCDATLRGDSGSLASQKRGGLYVFTGKRPEAVSVSGTGIYQDTRAAVSGYYIKLWLIRQRRLWPKGVTGCRLKVKPREELFLCIEGFGEYALLAGYDAGEPVIWLRNADYADICWQYHASVNNGDYGDPFLIGEHDGGGLYRLQKPPEHNLKRFEDRVAPLSTLTASDTGELIFPVPGDEKDKSLIVFRKNEKTRLSLANGQMNEFILEEG